MNMSLQTATRVARLRRARDICTDNELSWHDIHDDDGLRVEVTNYNDCPVHLVRATAEVDACVEDVFDWASDVNAWRTYSQNNTTIDYRVIEHHGNYRITHIISKVLRHWGHAHTSKAFDGWKELAQARRDRTVARRIRGRA